MSERPRTWSAAALAACDRASPGAGLPASRLDEFLESIEVAADPALDEPKRVTRAGCGISGPPCQWWRPRPTACRSLPARPAGSPA